MEWTPTYTAIIAAVISSSVLVVGLDPVLYELRRRRLYRGWQAVQLDNGQFYFGKITKLTREEVTLTGIYYLRDIVRKQPVYTSVLGYSDEQLNSTTELIKLGEEIHGPYDEMIISKAHIVFSENLKPTATVVRAILDHERQERVNDMELV